MCVLVCICVFAFVCMSACIYVYVFVPAAMLTWRSGQSTTWGGLKPIPLPAVFKGLFFDTCPECHLVCPGFRSHTDRNMSK